MENGMTDDEKIISGKSIFQSVLNLTSVNDAEDKKISSVWNQVVSKIGSNKNSSEDEKNCDITLGERMAMNSRVVDLKKGILLVETKHSGWIQYFRMYQNFIIKGLNWALPNLQIKSLGFRLEGSNAKLSDNYDDVYKKAKAEMDRKIENQEEELNKKFNFSESSKKENAKNEDLPPEFYEMFDKLTKSVESAEQNND